MAAVTLNLDSITYLTHELFHELCRDNRDLQLELTADRKLIVMPPTDWRTGRRNAALTADLWIWNHQADNGIAFGSSTGFILPNSAVRSPDTAWVQLDRITTLDPEPEGFLPLAPDFLVELRSASDHLSTLQDKMKEYIENGVRLGWLLNPQDKEVEIYRQGKEIEILRSPIRLSGEDVLTGFVLELKEIFGS